MTPMGKKATGRSGDPSPAIEGRESDRPAATARPRIRNTVERASRVTVA